MTITDPEGNVTVFVRSFDATDASTDVEHQYSAPGTVTVGALADAICTAEGLPTGGMSLMQQRVYGVLPILELRATVLTASSIDDGEYVILTPGT